MSFKPTNIEISRLLKEVAAVYSVLDERKYRFQIIAYLRVSDILEKLSQEAFEMWNEGKLKDLEGVGSSIYSHLEELFKTGKVEHFEQIKKMVPPSFFPLLQISKVGPKTAFKLITALKITHEKTAVDDLEKAAKNGEIAQISTFGEKSQQEILQAIIEFRQGKLKTSRMILPYAYEISQKIIDHLRKCPEVLKIETLGSLRRMVSTIGDIDIAVASENPEKVINWFVKYQFIERLIEKGDHTSSFLTSGGKQVDLMVQSPKSWGSLLAHFTGSKDHNVKLRSRALNYGLSVSDYGIKIVQNHKLPQVLRKYYSKDNYDKDLDLYTFETEEVFYEAQGLKWIPPEIREGTVEIELSEKDQLPQLVDINDIKGDLHLHSSFDIETSHDNGQNTASEMLFEAKKLKYAYLGFSEHNPSVGSHTEKKMTEILKKRNKYIEQESTQEKSVQTLNLLEVDILTNGELAVSDSSLQELDACIVSIHSSFNLSKEKMTERVLKGLNHKKAKILAHPTGRLLNQRSGYELDWEQIWDFCLENNKAVEINSYPTRLDISENLVREAVKRGVKLVINTDSHDVSQMDNMRFGVAVARRGWATKKDILNCFKYQDLLKWLRNN